MENYPKDAAFYQAFLKLNNAYAYNSFYHTAELAACIDIIRSP